jgi:O-glycosyl hydrolase
VDLKIILPVWTPPPRFKSNGSATWGGYVTDAHAEEFGNWLVDGLDLYHDLGHDVYALSFQNESYFSEPYNSGVYTVEQYNKVLGVVEPIIHDKYPEVKLFGAEHMVDQEGSYPGGWNGPYYSNYVMKNGNKLDAYAVHGYSDGILSMAVSGASEKWKTYRESLAGSGKPIWMTETSGYDDSWNGVTSGGWNYPGAFILAQMIGIALKEGHLSAWVYWQGSRSDGANHECLFWKNLTVGKRYAVSKHFYRYIRPGAKMVGVTYTDSDLLIIPFSHEEEHRFTVIVLNSSEIAKKIKLNGDALGTDFMFYQTRAAAGTNCAATFLNPANPTEIVVPPMSVVTLVNSHY